VKKELIKIIKNRLKKKWLFGQFSSIFSFIYSEMKKLNNLIEKFKSISNNVLENIVYY